MLVFFLLCTVRYIFFGTKVISGLIGLIYENIAKMANKSFNIPNHLKVTFLEPFNRYNLKPKPLSKLVARDIDIPMIVYLDHISYVFYARYK